MATPSSRKKVQKNSSRRPFAVITGGSSGIGFELAREFAEDGYDLLIAADGEDVHEAARKLEVHGAHVESEQVDLATQAGVEELYSKIKAMKRPVDVLALNAGVGVSGRFA